MLKNLYTSRSILCDVVNSHDTVPSPPATSNRMGFGAQSTLHCKAAAGGLSARSITCAGLRMRRNSERIASPSLLPERRLATTIRGDQSGQPGSFTPRSSRWRWMLLFMRAVCTHHGGTMSGRYGPKSHSVDINLMHC